MSNTRRVQGVYHVEVQNRWKEGFEVSFLGFTPEKNDIKVKVTIPWQELQFMMAGIKKSWTAYRASQIQSINTIDGLNLDATKP